MIVWVHYASKYILPIKYNAGLDKEELAICNTDFIPQYYFGNTGYSGGKRAIKKKLLPLIKKERIEFGS